MKVYISGKITGDTDYKQKFDRAAEFLCNIGHEAINPTVIDAQLTYDEYMRIDLAMLSVCDAIYLLDGWEDSNGANIEYNAAKQKGLRVYFQGQDEEKLIQK